MDPIEVVGARTSYWRLYRNPSKEKDAVKEAWNGEEGNHGNESQKRTCIERGGEPSDERGIFITRKHSQAKATSTIVSGTEKEPKTSTNQKLKPERICIPVDAVAAVADVVVVAIVLWVP